MRILPVIWYVVGIVVLVWLFRFRGLGLLEEPETQTCSWRQRRVHRKGRMLDRMAYQMSASRFDPRLNPVLFEQAWEAFKRDPGREHWRCPCAHAEFIDEIARQLAGEKETTKCSDLSGRRN